MEKMIGTIERGINNIYTVVSGTSKYLCRIKGKQLMQVTGEYNPLAVGDEVSFQANSSDEGLILDRMPRRNCFQRWNVKGSSNQTIVANMDLIVCVTSSDTPPFRPRFIDRVIACSQDVKVLLVMNKSDILLTEEEYERFMLYKELGYDIAGVSALTGENIEDFCKLLKGKVVAFIGQSGVGKSTLINRILDAGQRTGEVSTKFNRGRHTTNHALMIHGPEFTIVDTPGFREIMVPHGDPHRLLPAFPEFTKPSQSCSYLGCLHNDEPDCEVKRLVEAGEIHYDRYESYLRMLSSLDDKTPEWMGKRDTSKSWHNRMENNEHKEY